MDAFADIPDEELSDTLLLARFRSGDNHAATLLFRRYARRLYAVARSRCGDLAPRVDPEDIVQSVFRSFFQRALTGHYDAPEGEELWQLLVIITLNEVRSQAAYHSAQKRSIHVTQEDGGVLSKLTSQRQENEAAFRELMLLVEEVLKPLAAEPRRMVQLRLEGYEVEEIARKTDCSKRTVERVLQEFRQSLRTKLE